ncbi:putative cytochrome P450 [Aspergillus costaricaensis CBS 115574]|uniref:Cytochrome P450 n=1 Tax=Aspergillus costaricaensis CBS 115574 TaxID=1448317 RepID=A0ACD1IJG7_9EURO|nr:putative cytochrome P450 [Aspergillus costaricaensis CBS 115574]RAK90790.1 putative cytochrome P450 [Aspergillus costaricaensis CBS 115574]
MLTLETLSIMYWGILPLALLYYFWDLSVTRTFTRAVGKHPVVGSSSCWAPRIFLNLVFAANASWLVKEGYHKYKNGTFQLLRGSGSALILPISVLEELAGLPPSVASPHAALEHDLLGAYTGLDIILESRMHHTIVQRKLTPRLPSLTPALQRELVASLDELFPDCADWAEIQPFRVLGKVTARLSARAMLGHTFCRNPQWLDISVHYTENLFQTIVILRLFPSWMHPALSRCLPSFWRCQAYLRSTKDLLGPVIRDMIEENDKGSFSPKPTEDNFNVLTWLVEAAKGSDRNPDTLAHVEILLALASVHTILLRNVNVLYDLIENPQYIDELREEIHSVWATTGWIDTADSYSKLHKLDSVLRESQRLSPPTILGLKRLFKQPYTFSSGISINQGTYVALPVMAIENDPDHTVNPERFDGLRSYRMFQNMDGSRSNRVGHQFSTVDKTVLNFGYGKTSCPGRHFASLVIKMVFVKLLTAYEFRFLPGKGRPKNYEVHEFLFPWPWDSIQVRNREDRACPF